MPQSATVTTVAAPRDGPVVKRQKTAAERATITNANGKRRPLVAPFRTIGLISPTDVPFAIDPRGKTTFNITTSVGRSLQTYDLRRGLHLIFITRPQTPENITAIAEWKDLTLAAWGSEHGTARINNNGVWVYKRGQKTGELETPPGKSENIKQLLALGSWIVGCGKTTIQVWSSATFEHHTTIHTGQGRSRATITGGICNMPTYLNKILVGTSDGCLEVWNVSSGKLRYTIFPSESDMGAVTTMEPTPALSLFAVAYASGDVRIHDVRMDKPIISLSAGSRQAPVTTISFRTDGLGAGEDGQAAGVMATATKSHGDITFWDLNNGGRKMSVLRGAHSPPSTNDGGVSGGISKIEFLPGQGVIVTSGMDNALKSWIFDEQPFSATPRPLHSRSGHAAPVSSLKFLPAGSDGSEADGKWLMSASRDRSLWGWSLRRDAQSAELSQGSVRKKAKNLGILNSALSGPDGTPSLEELKAPKIICMACSLNRDGGMGAMPGTKEIWVAPGKHKSTSTAESSMTGWESVVTGHEGDRFARTWFWGRKRAGRWKLETADGANVSSVAVSPCGTFAVIGSEAGGIDVYNLQSGIKRQRFPALLTKKQAERLKSQTAESMELQAEEDKKFARGQGKHTKAVTGIQMDSLNQTVISCGADGKVKFWDFNKGVLLHELDWSLTSIRGMRYHNSTDLMALSCDDSSIRVVDVVTKKLVREFWGCSGKIPDFTFSSDGRWLAAISEDSVLRIWDLPTGHLIEALRFKSKPTAIAFSPTGEYLATAHEDSVGVHIWNNRTLFTNVPTRRISNEDVADVDAPVASGENTETALEAAFDAGSQALELGDETAAAPSIDQLSSDLLTLSLVPKAKWQTLLHLDAIRTRNKPKEPPKAPEKAPFFLPSLNKSNTNTITSIALVAAQPQEKAVSRITTLTSAQQASAFTVLLRDNPMDVVTYLSNLSPSAADLTIRTLDPSPPYAELTTFVGLLTDRLREKRDYELTQTYMSVFLQCHGAVVLESEELREALREWDEASTAEVKRLGDLVGFCKGVGGWIGGVV